MKLFLIAFLVFWALHGASLYDVAIWTLYVLFVAKMFSLRSTLSRK